jgi:hypothetical protein
MWERYPGPGESKSGISPARQKLDRAKDAYKDLKIIFGEEA